MANDLNSLKGEFARVLSVDFEFSVEPGHHPVPSLMCVVDLISGERRHWRGEELREMSEAPFPVDRSTLFICHNASAEMGCFAALGWKKPKRLIDTMIEEKNRRLGMPNKVRFGLLHCLQGYGLRTRDVADKDYWRSVGIAGGPTSEEVWAGFIDYCYRDCDDGAALFLKQLPNINIHEACLRGRYACHAAQIEHNGIPVDVPLFNHMKNRWPTFRHRLIDEVNPRYGVYVDGSFSYHQFQRYLKETNTPWPRLFSGQLDMRDETFRNMVKAYNHLAPLRELRHTLSNLNLFESIAIGPDGRSRTDIRTFASRTSRNQPSSAKYLFGAARAIRSLLQPKPGHVLAYLDYSSQEWAIGAALSGDANMMQAYLSGDVYLEFARQAGAVPAGATKATHPVERALFKAAALAVQYGMGRYGLSARIGGDRAAATELLLLHRLMYADFRRWVEMCVDTAYYTGRYRTCFGWHLNLPPADEFGVPRANPRSVQNFPCQAHGAEMLRLAVIYLMEAGIEVVAPVHDAVLIHVPLEGYRESIDQSKRLMREASGVVMGGFECRVDEDVVVYPNHYSDPAGADFWQLLLKLAGPVPGR